MEDIRAPLSLVYFSPESVGGLGDYAHEQASAMRFLGIDVRFLTTPKGVAAKPDARYHRKSVLFDLPDRFDCPSRIARRLGAARAILRNTHSLVSYCRRHGLKHAVFGAFFEYLAPIWSPWLNRLASQGVTFGSVVHDPTRSFIVGPRWWHRWSTACGYSFVQEAFVHDPILLDTVRPMPRLRTTVIPHGPYPFPEPKRGREEMRHLLKIPRHSELLLAFGQIRDSKNLHLVLEAMVECPEFHLVVAGARPGGSQRPISYYQGLAGQLGINPRCRWETKHIAPDKVGDFFEAADLVLLTYCSGFRSASGVLNTAVRFKKPCLASSGQSNLKTVVENYGLGYWVVPDSVEGIVKGLRLWLKEKPQPKWAAYAAENSWERNAKLVIEHVFRRAVAPA